ncbi:immunity 53 family protein [Hymenobacter sp. BT186]|uniref:Immunity 53 family protein n=1 Tax=Hymenobacter telluris TaxID=2816474 RepID=A0A939F240_9BACT|nr:immunity 53 family protein [Hymenobacter telluris]MBO0359993.1 immunity 53 family protein [Hymenobacter telluris]MBW3376020.1 immunity 53 family protein [Hymenobacter norwichensis]
MDLLQRIQRWYTINCNGDWEHDYGISVWHGISVQTLDNPGWIVSIDLEDTCVKQADLPYVLHERNTTDWFGYKVENGKFEGVGGPENLSEILSYFLDTFLPAHIDPTCTLEIHLPVLGYENRLWLKAEAKMLSESVVEITAVADRQHSQSYEWGLDTDLDLLNELESSLSELQVDYVLGDNAEPYVFQSNDNMLRTFLVAPSKS